MTHKTQQNRHKKPPEYSTIITKKNTSLKIKYSLSVKDNKAMITAVGNPI